MREGNFSRLRRRSATHQTGVRNRVVRRPEGTGSHEAGASRKQPGNAVHARDLNGLVIGHGRQDGGERFREERLATSRTAAHEEVVAASGRHLHGAFRLFLSYHVLEIRSHHGGWRRGHRWPRLMLGDGNGAEEMRGQSRQALHRIDREAFNECCFRSVGARHRPPRAARSLGRAQR